MQSVLLKTILLHLKAFLYKNWGKTLGPILGLALQMRLFGVVLGVLVGSFWDVLIRERRTDRGAEQLLRNPGEERLWVLPKKERAGFLLAALGREYFFHFQGNDALWDSISDRICTGLTEEKDTGGGERLQRCQTRPGDIKRTAELVKPLLPDPAAAVFLTRLMEYSPGAAPPAGVELCMILAEVWDVTPAAGENPARDYELLGLTPDADDNEVRQTFRALASHFHPDTAAGLSPHQKKEAEEAFLRIRNAFERISRLRGM